MRRRVILARRSTIGKQSASNPSHTTNLPRGLRLRVGIHVVEGVGHLGRRLAALLFGPARTRVLAGRGGANPPEAAAPEQRPGGVPLPGIAAVVTGALRRDRCLARRASAPLAARPSCERRHQRDRGGLRRYRPGPGVGPVRVATRRPVAGCRVQMETSGSKRSLKHLSGVCYGAVRSAKRSLPRRERVSGRAEPRPGG
jgi:hypothetical protein